MHLAVQPTISRWTTTSYMSFFRASIRLLGTTWRSSPSRQLLHGAPSPFDASQPLEGCRGWCWGSLLQLPWSSVSHLTCTAPQRCPNVSDLYGESSRRLKRKDAVFCSISRCCLCKLPFGIGEHLLYVYLHVRDAPLGRALKKGIQISHGGAKNQLSSKFQNSEAI